MDKLNRFQLNALASELPIIKDLIKSLSVEGNLFFSTERLSLHDQWAQNAEQKLYVFEPVGCCELPGGLVGVKDALSPSSSELVFVRWTGNDCQVVYYDNVAEMVALLKSDAESFAKKLMNRMRR